MQALIASDVAGRARNGAWARRLADYSRRACVESDSVTHRFEVLRALVWGVAAPRAPPSGEADRGSVRLSALRALVDPSRLRDRDGGDRANLNVKPTSHTWGPNKMLARHASTIDRQP